MNSSTFGHRASARWFVHRTALPLIRRQCLVCACSRYQATGALRVNANGKLLDIWLLAACVRCDQTIKLEVFDRVHVRTVDPDLLDRLYRNDAGLVLKLLTDPAVLRRNRVSLDWQDAWDLRADAVDLSAAEVIDVDVCFEHRIPVRLVRLLALGLHVPRAEAERFVGEDRITLTRRFATTVSEDFGFTLKVL